MTPSQCIRRCRIIPVGACPAWWLGWNHSCMATARCNAVGQRPSWTAGGAVTNAGPVWMQEVCVRGTLHPDRGRHPAAAGGLVAAVLCHRRHPAPRYMCVFTVPPISLAWRLTVTFDESTEKLLVAAELCHRRHPAPCRMRVVPSSHHVSPAGVGCAAVSVHLRGDIGDGDAKQPWPGWSWQYRKLPGLPDVREFPFARSHAWWHVPPD